MDREEGPKLREVFLPRPVEIGRQGLERASKELQAVIQHRMLTRAERQVARHALAD